MIREYECTVCATICCRNDTDITTGNKVAACNICGGTVVLKKYDNFNKNHSPSKCDICYNKATALCNTCKWQ